MGPFCDSTVLLVDWDEDRGSPLCMRVSCVTVGSLICCSETVRKQDAGKDALEDLD